jgi:type II secretory pathway pseudopilin PulG
MIELMIGVAIVGTLSAVALPQLTKAQNTAKSSAARSTAINTAKTCSVAIIADTPTDGNIVKTTFDSTSKDVKAKADVTCAVSNDTITTSFAFTGGGEEWKVDLDKNGIGKNAEKVVAGNNP